MHKIKSGTLTAETIKNNFKANVKRFVASDNAFSFISSAKETPPYWKHFAYNVLALVKQLGIPTYVLVLT